MPTKGPPEPSPGPKNGVAKLTNPLPPIRLENLSLSLMQNVQSLASGNEETLSKESLNVAKILFDHGG